MLSLVPSPDQPLPEYGRPPVVEVALAVQMDDVIGFRSLDMGALAAAWADDFPVVEERVPLPMMTPGWDDPEMSLEVGGEAQTPRLWLQNEVGNRVVQLQQDRLAVNWQKGESDDLYPRYASIREALVEAWDRLDRVADDLSLTLPRPEVCEVLYVNHLGADQGWRSAEDTATLIAARSGAMSDGFLPANPHEGLLLHYHLPDGRGWLNIDGWTTDAHSDERIMVLTLVSRGSASSPTLDGALDFMDLAHEWIVRGFTSVTTVEAHRRWRRTA